MMEQLKAISHYNPETLASEVNAYIKELYDLNREIISITFTTAPWADDGAAGTNYTAFVLSATCAY